MFADPLYLVSKGKKAIQSDKGQVDPSVHCKKHHFQQHFINITLKVFSESQQKPKAFGRTEERDLIPKSST